MAYSVSLLLRTGVALLVLRAFCFRPSTLVVTPRTGESLCGRLRDEAVDLVFSIGGTDCRDRLDELAIQLERLFWRQRQQQTPLHVRIVLDDMASKSGHTLASSAAMKEWNCSSNSNVHVSWYHVNTTTENRFLDQWHKATGVRPAVANSNGRHLRLFLQEIFPPLPSQALPRVLHLDTRMLVTDFEKVYNIMLCGLTDSQWISTARDGQILGLNLRAMSRRASPLPILQPYVPTCPMFPDYDVLSLAGAQQQSSLSSSSPGQHYLRYVNLPESLSLSSLRPNSDTVVLMSDTRPRESVFTLKTTFDINRGYARQQGYSFHLYNPLRCHNDSDFSCSAPPSKLLSVEDFVSCPLFGTVLFLDSDAFVREWPLSVRSFLGLFNVSAYQLVVPTDCPPKSRHNSGIQVWNAADANARALLAEWVRRVRSSPRRQRRHPFEQGALDDWYEEPNSTLMSALRPIPSGPDSWNHGACQPKYVLPRWIAHITGGWRGEQQEYLEAARKSLLGN